MNPTIFSRYIRGTLIWPCPMYHRSWFRDTVNNSCYILSNDCELEGAWEVEDFVTQFRSTSRHFQSRAVSKHEKSPSSGVLGDGRTGSNIGHCGFLQYFFSTIQQLWLPMYFQMLTYSHPPLKIVSLPLATMYNIRCWISVVKLPDSRMSLCQNQRYIHSYIIP